MATGYRVFNTVVSGSSVYSYLNGNDVRLLQFDSALKQKPAIVLDSDVTLDVEQWMQASIGSLLLNASAAGTHLIDLGPDVASQAAAYVSLFDFKALGEQRLLRFVLANTGASNTSLGNSGSTFAHVSVTVQGLTGPSFSEPLFIASTGPANYLSGNGAGIQRLVIVSPTNITVGSEAVDFTILPFSN